jgi:NAD(P) transhydrogenase subunit beta
MSEHIIEVTYLASGVLFILALRWLSAPRTARRGVQAGELGMLLAIIATLLRAEIVSYEWILVGLFVGSAIGVPMALLMPMTAMPQRTALSHAFGALAAALVGISEYFLQAPNIDRFTMGALGFEVLLGCLTFTGSLMAFGKLQGILPGRPIVYRGQNVINLSLLAIAVALAVYLVIDPAASSTLFLVVVALSLVFGVFLIIPIGGADMPTVISLLNSYAGLSGAAMGFALNNKVLIIAGALDGASGFLLSLIMSRAMNRNFRNIIFGAFGQVQASTTEDVEERPVRSGTAEEASMIFEVARLVIIVPGYGMAVSQAQHKVRELSDVLTKRGTEVKFAIHPVAGRMPGHMNVLLAEADVPYDQLVEMDEINSDFPRADVAIVIGANDVTNPAARSNQGSPIYGMPILEVDKARSVMVIKRSMAPGFAGIENELYYQDKTMMLFGDARAVVGDLVSELSQLRVES